MAKTKDTKTDEQIHAGRREKLRQSFNRFGLETFNETQVLEFALGMCIPRMDTNPTAHRLMGAFGSLDGVISAGVEKLLLVDGVGTQAANFLHFLKQFVTYYMGIERTEHCVFTTEDAILFLRPLMKTYSTEHFIIICMNAKGVVIANQNIRGDIEHVGINVREVVDATLRVNSSAVVLAHNHPSGITAPSGADIALTRTIIGVLNPVGVKVIDHIIFGDTPYSFAQNGIIGVLTREQVEFAKSTDFEDLLE
jgi:DNA repair protein RadC